MIFAYLLSTIIFVTIQNESISHMNCVLIGNKILTVISDLMRGKAN